jgi:hypothetical protein
LADEAWQQPGALPLLSFLLDALYAQDIEAGRRSTLRYETMRKLGGFQGAIATRAEAAFAELPAAAQAALPKVLRALVTVSRSGSEATARPAPMNRFPPQSDERRVVDAFLDPRVRLLVADGDGSSARVRLAHEALITHWDRAKRQIAQDRDDLRTRAVIEEALAEWQAAMPADKRGYLLRDPQLANATDLIKRWDEFPPETLAFVQAGRRRARLRQQLSAAAALLFGVVAIAAGLAAHQAYRAQQLAQDESAKAEAAKQDAVKSADAARVSEQQAVAALVQAQRSESMTLAEQSLRETAAGDPISGMRLAVSALPRNREQPDRAPVARAVGSRRHSSPTGSSSRCGQATTGSIARHTAPMDH